MFDCTRILKIIDENISNFPDTAMILGSGWNSVMSQVEVEQELSYDQLLGVQASVPGHLGALVIGRLEGRRVACMVGRLHTYEGYTSEEVTRPIQAFAQRGLRTLIVTAAAGGLAPEYQVGDFVILSNMITAFCQSPLTGPRFIDLSAPFDPQLKEQTYKFARHFKYRAHQGTYCYVRGPHFETPADKRLYRQLGADVVGMSIVPETIMARSLSIKVLGVAFVTNLAFVVHDHQDVLAAAKDGSQRMTTLLRAVVSSLE